MQFETLMMNNYWAFNAALAALNLFTVSHLARKLGSGAAMSVAGFFVSLVVSVLTAAVVVAVMAAFFSRHVLRMAATNPSGFAAWSWEAGIEFGLLGIVAGIVGYVVFRLRAGAT